MNYKEDFNEWASDFYEECGRKPDLKECEEFRDHWIYIQESKAQAYKEWLMMRGHTNKTPETVPG